MSLKVAVALKERAKADGFLTASIVGWRIYNRDDTPTEEYYVQVPLPLRFVRLYSPEEYPGKIVAEELK